MSKQIRPLRGSISTSVPPWEKLYKDGETPDILVAISSCQLYEDRGWHESSRQTWLSEAKRLGVDYKFFFGYGAKQKDDVVLVKARDNYFDLTSKLKEKLGWASFQGYKYVFSCLADCYASPERLLNSGFEKYDYFGDVYQHFGGNPYCQGGPGCFYSKKACNIVYNSPGSYPNEDCFAGDQLNRPDIVRGDSKDFVWCGHFKGMGPMKDNTHISVHLSNAQGGFRPEQILEKHNQWLDSWK